MIDPRKVNKIVGPPGTGKTTALLKVVDDLLTCGTDPHRICFVAFTRRAAQEAKSRAVQKFGISPDDLPLFRTLHSLAFKQLGLNKNVVMGVSDYILIAKELGLFLTLKGISEDGMITGMSKGDRLMFMEMMSRARMMPLRDYWEQFPNEDIYFYELERLHKTIANYKQNTGKRDFIDMIADFCDADLVPEMDALIVDEAQDLSPLQWRMVELLAEHTDNVQVAGDDDQAIFTWAGADVQRFINLEGNQRVLDQSYRCPARIQEFALGIASRINERIDKSYKPRDSAGIVEFVSSLEQVDLSSGTWLILARNMFLLEQAVEYCKTAGVVFDSPLGSPVKGPVMRSIVNWEELRKGNTISVAAAREIYDLISVRVGVTYGSKAKLDREPDDRAITLKDLMGDFGLVTNKIWHEALDKIPAVMREYFLSALRKGEKLLRDPRVKISTIHSVKGGEADHVVLFTDMAQRTFKEFHTDPDPEHRVWYVAVTRARESLHVVQAQTNMFYPL